VYQLSQEATDAFEAARRKAQRFLGAAHEHEVVFVRGTTEGINLVAAGFAQAFLGPGKEVLITAMDHHSNIVPWQMACERSGASLKIIPILPNGELDMEAFEGLLSERTAIVALPHVSNTLGTINPVATIIAKAHELGVPVLLDGAQAAPHLPLDVQALDVDFYACSGHKMYGPTGIGLLYGKEHWLEKLPPYQGGGEMIETVTFEKTTYGALPHKFEAGTPNIAGAVALGAAVDFLESLEPARVQAHEHALLEYATEKLLEIPGLKIYGTAPEKAGVVSFLVEGTHPYDVGTILDKLGIAVRTGHHCTQPLMDWFGIPGTVRASFGVYNTLSELDRLVAGVRQAARMLG
ncbi:MAG: cysteine desulfurase, partial [Bacteroidetes bacterium]